MSEPIRQISIVILFGLAFFCLQVGVFLMSGLFGDETAEKNALALVKFAQGMLEDIEDFNVASRMEIKGKGEMKTYFLK